MNNGNIGHVRQRILRGRRELNIVTDYSKLLPGEKCHWKKSKKIYEGGIDDRIFSPGERVCVRDYMPDFTGPRLINTVMEYIGPNRETFSKLRVLDPPPAGLAAGQEVTWPNYDVAQIIQTRVSPTAIKKVMAEKLKMNENDPFISVISQMGYGKKKTRRHTKRSNKTRKNKKY